MSCQAGGTVKGVVGPDIDPAGVGGDAVDPIQHGDGLIGGGEGVAVDFDRVLDLPPGATGPVSVAEPFLGLGVDADHRLSVLEEGSGRGVELYEPGGVVRMAGVLSGLDGALQAMRATGSSNPRT